MKKFLALLFVCAGLTAMAAPQVNKTDLNQNKGQMVMKANTLSNHMTAGVSKSFMEGAKKAVVKANTNLVNKRAPRRITGEDIISKPYVCFLYAAGYDQDGNYVEDDPFFAGSGAYWYPEIDEDGTLYFAGYYWDDEGSTYYLPTTVDYETGEVALSWGLLLRDDTVKHSGRTGNDTIRWHALFSEAYFLDGEQNDCMGTLYEDGSIIFDDNYVYYREDVIKKYVNGRLTGTDTVVNATVFIATEILAANGILNYNREQNGAADDSYVFMYQNADTLYVGNMWNYGMPNVVMTIDSDAKMHYNCVAETTEEGTVYLENPVWDIDDSWIQGGLGMCYAIGGYTETEDGYIDELLWGFEGDVTPEKITWDYAAASNGYHLFYGFNNNVLTWINGGKFEIPGGGDAEPGDVNNDGSINIDDITTLIDHMLKDDFDDSDEFSSTGADVNQDGSIDIDDLTALLDMMLS